MTNQTSDRLSPVLYVPHGGGPLPVLGDDRHEKMVSFLKEIVHKLAEPSAIVVISAHWEENQATVTAGSRPELIYDYFGFPPQAYQIQYTAPGHPRLAKEVVDLLKSHGIPAKLDDQRGFDHGLFIPLKLMYPKAEIPCIQLSLLRNLNPSQHMSLGKSISELRKQNVLILGSGMPFHNLRAFFSADLGVHNEDEEFGSWLIETCTGNSLSSEEREQRLREWENAPYARFCHPREEHLLPLHVCYGAASVETMLAEVVFNQEIMGRKVCSFRWS